MGITIKELKEFLSILPEHMDDFEMVNGEVSQLIENNYYARVDKPVIHLEIDEKTKEFLLLHQSEEEINNIVDNVRNGNPKED
jgi:hypothetical protein